MLQRREQHERCASDVEGHRGVVLVFSFTIQAIDMSSHIGIHHIGMSVQTY